MTIPGKLLTKFAGVFVLVVSLKMPVPALADSGSTILPPRFDLAACEADALRNFLECNDYVHYNAYHDCLAELRGWGHPTYFHEYCERLRDMYFTLVCYNTAQYELLLCKWIAGGRVGDRPPAPPEFQWPSPPSLPQPSTPPDEYVPAPPPGEEPPAAVAPAPPPPVAPAPPPPAPQ